MRNTISPLLERTLWNGCFFFTGCCCREVTPGLVWVSSHDSSTGGSPYTLAAFDPETGIIALALQTFSTISFPNFWVRFGGDEVAWTQGDGEHAQSGTFSRWTADGNLIGETPSPPWNPAFDQHGNFYGIRRSAVNGIIKYNSAGVYQGQIVDDPDITGGALAIDLEDNLIFRDYRHLSSGGYGLSKYDSGGSLLWREPFAGSEPFGDTVRVCVDADGNIYAGGRKWDADGNVVWDVADPFDSFLNAQIGPDGFLYCTRPGTLRKLDPADGSRVWKVEASKVTSYFGGTDEPDVAFPVNDLCVSGDHVYTVCGRSSSGGIEPTVRKFTTDGDPVWAIDTERWCVSVDTAPGMPILFQ